MFPGKRSICMHKGNGTLIDRLVKDAHKGSITLVLGAGVSMSAGAPSWESLVRAVWAEVRSKKKRPTWLGYSDSQRHSVTNAFESLRSDPSYQVLSREGFDLMASAPHPLALQMVLEELEESLRSTSASNSDPAGEARDRLAETIRSCLYQKINLDESTSLASVVQVLRADQQRSVRRVSRVISLNADDLIESLANRGHDPERDPVVWPISRASYHPRRGACANGLPPIPIYHLHGYLPRPENSSRDAPDTLVFTDAQYWTSVASPISFANRVMANALHDSHCVFIGTSMTDVNLMRWLGTHFSELRADKLSQYLSEGKAPRLADKAAGRALRRHYWLRTDSSDSDNLITAHVYRRGVFSVSLQDWKQDFSGLMQACFLDDS